jgi:hypothetical protein
MHGTHTHALIKRCSLLLMVVFALAGLLSACANAGEKTQPETVTPIAAQSSAIPVVSITAVDYGYEMPTSIDVRAGLIDFAMVNNGTQPHQTQIARLHNGVTRDQVLDALITRRNQAAALALLTLVGGPDTIAPGYGQEAILNLPAGQYVLLCLVVGSDGIPHVDKGMFHFFTVSAAPAPGSASVPETDGTVIMNDAGYQIPNSITQARALTLQVTNRGSAPHDMNIVKLATGKGVQDIAAFFQAPSGPPPFEEVGGMAALAPGASGWIRLHLDPGNYVALSFIPDPRTGRLQFTRGLVPFTVSA